VDGWQLLANQLVPRALQRALDADKCCEQNVKLSRLDLLHSAQVQVGEFGQPLLSQTFGSALATDVCPESYQLRLNFLGGCHAPLSRKKGLDLNGLMGRNLHSEER
jgi:hypothetical protein